MELLRNEASILLNSICFRRLEKSRYDFSFRHSERKIVYIPIQVSTPSPGPPPSPSSPFPVDSSEQKNQQQQQPSVYYVPCMLIRGRNMATSGSSSSSSSSPTSSSKSKVPIARNVIVHFHGTSGDIEKSHVWANMRKNLPDFDILCVEFPGGYGTSSPRFPSSASSTPPHVFEPFLCSRESLMAVARGVTDFLIQRARIREEDIIFSGRSMGSGPATELAAKYYPRCGGLILLSPYASMSGVIRGVVEKKIKTNTFFIRSIVSTLVGSLLSFLCKFGRTSLFEPKDVIENIDCPTWIAHGKKDTLIPLAHAEQLVSMIQISSVTSPSRRRTMMVSAMFDDKSANDAPTPLFSSPSSPSPASSPAAAATAVFKNADKQVTLHVDPEGDHPNVEFTDSLTQYLNEYSLQRRQEQQQQETRQARTSSWDDLPFANQKVLDQLKENFGRDMEAAKNFKRRCKRTLIISAVVALACSVAVSSVIWKYFNRRKLFS